MTRRVLSRVSAGAALLLACTPTEPCACPPARTSAILYGEVRTAEGAPVGGALLGYVFARPLRASAVGNICEFDPALNDADPPGATTDATGRFRTELFSVFSADTRCVRVTASAAAGSAQVEGLLVPFSHTRPDSVGLVLTLR